MLEQHFPVGQLIKLVQETQRGSYWKVRDAADFVAPHLGSRLGTVEATDIFNSVFK